MKTTLTSLFWITIVGIMFVGGSALGFESVEKDNHKSSIEISKYSDVCRHISHMVRQGRGIGTKAEIELGMYDDLKLVLRKYRFTEKAISILQDTQGYTTWLSAIDLDNDGVEELRLRHGAGSGHCEENYFFKKDRTGKYEYIAERGLDLTRGRLCSFGSLSFFRHKGQNYLTIYSSPFAFPQKIALYSGKRDGFHYECTIQALSDQVDASTTCKKPICEVVRQEAQNIVNDARGGHVFHVAEQPIKNVASLTIDWNSLQPFERKGQLYSIDLDNDGINELLIKQKTSPANTLYYTILKEEAGIYRAIDPNSFYKNFKLLGTSDEYLFDDNLVFQRSSDKNYIISIHFGSRNNKYPKSCRLEIFVIEKSNVSKVGTVNTSFKKLKDNLSHEKD